MATFARAGGRALLLLAALLLLTAPRALADEHTTFAATLSGDNEVPAVTSAAFGVAYATFNPDTNELTVTGSFEGLTDGYNFGIGAHIHEAPAGSNGPIVLALSPKINDDNASGAFAPGVNTFVLTETQVTALFDGNFYVNIHSVGFPSGELRGQLTPSAQVQIVHNSPDPVARRVDIYVNGTLLVDNLRFRRATPYVDLPAGTTDIEVRSLDSNAQDAVVQGTLFGSFMVGLESGERYQAVATGVVAPENFSGNPDFESINFDLEIISGSRATSPRATRVAVNALHGAPDAPTVQLSLRDNYAGRSATITYGDQTRYFLPSARRDYIIDVSLPDTDTAKGTVIASFFGPAFSFQTAGLGGAVMASGFLTAEDEPGLACEGCIGRFSDFRLIAVAPNGSVGALPPAPLPGDEPTVAQAGGASALAAELALDANYPNPFASVTQIRFTVPEQAEVGVQVFDVLGREVLTIAPSTFEGGAQRHIDLDGSSLASGTYLYRLNVTAGATAETLTGQMTVLK
ncbi:MAG: CHRD domain-containing protein [Bacteroidota bacterium]